MSKLACVCGYVISDVAYPSETEGLLLREGDEGPPVAQERVASYIDALLAGAGADWAQRQFPDLQDPADRDLVLDRIFAAALKRSLSVAECASCGRLHVQREPYENQRVAYSPDEPATRAILSTRKVET